MIRNKKLNKIRDFEKNPMLLLQWRRIVTVLDYGRCNSRP